MMADIRSECQNVDYLEVIKKLAKGYISTRKDGAVLALVQ